MELMINGEPQKRRSPLYEPVRIGHFHDRVLLVFPGQRALLTLPVVSLVHFRLLQKGFFVGMLGLLTAQ